MDRKSKIWMGTVAALLAALVVVALTLPRSFALTALSDIIQCLLLASATAAFARLAVHSRARIRLFWSLMSLGVLFWLGYQLFWTYYETVLRRDVPDLCTWDVVLFLHIVPFMAALALRPQVPRDEYSGRIGRLDFALLLVWWFYLYALTVTPWQYVVPVVPAYNRNLNNIYVSEQLFLLAGLLACWILSKGEWRKLYAALFGMSLCYSSSSTIANWALVRNSYYSGSLYDIPLVTSMAWLTWIALRTKAEKPEARLPDNSTLYGVWVARCSMIAALSLPLLATWAMQDTAVPPRIRLFRLTLTLLAAFTMGVMVLLRQRLLDRELFRLINRARESFDNLNRLQAQIIQSEKLASIGQLVGGAAHELNNPITAMLGYSDLLLNTPLTAEQQPLAVKIGQYVRRTKTLVASLISVARHVPAPKSALDLNTLARTAVKLAQPQWSATEIEIRTQFDPTLPKVMGVSNQLLQVCQQLVGNCLHVLSERGGKALTVSTEHSAGTCVLHIATEATTVPASDSSPIDPEDGLGLSACQVILQEHQGRVSRERQEDGAIRLRVELPAVDSAQTATKDAIAPALLQSRPYA